jgi:serine/threonine protein kinase
MASVALEPPQGGVRLLAHDLGSTVWLCKGDGDDGRLFVRKRTGSDMSRELAMLRRAAGHVGVVACDDAGHDDSGRVVCIDMPYLDGGDLSNLRGQPARRRDVAAAACAALARALAHVHARGLVHGDVRLENALYAAGSPEAPVLADFGMTVPAGQVSFDADLGQALAPELCCDEDKLPVAHTARDVWALGVAFVRLLTGLWSHDILRFVYAGAGRAGLAAKLEALGVRRGAELDVALALLDPNPDTRPSAGDAARVLATLLQVDA